MPSLIKYFCTGWLYWCDTALRRNWKGMIRKANTQQCQQCIREVSKIFSCTYKEFWSVWIMILCTFCGKSCQMWVKKLLPLYILSCRKVAMDYNGRYNLKPSFSLPNLLDSKKRPQNSFSFWRSLWVEQFLDSFNHCPHWTSQYAVLPIERQQEFQKSSH